MLSEDIAKLMAMIPHDSSPPSFLEASTLFVLFIPRAGKIVYFQWGVGEKTPLD